MQNNLNSNQHPDKKNGNSNQQPDPKNGNSIQQPDQVQPDPKSPEHSQTA
jgi:hypothetical protein